MLRVINACLGILVFVTAVWLYQLKYDVRAAVKRTHVLRTEITEIRQDLTLLEAEGTHLRSLARLEALAAKHLPLRPTEAEQVVPHGLLSSTLAMRVEEVPEEPAADPIGSLLGQTQ